MPKHGTASVSGAYLELQSAVLKALPRDIDDELALNWAGNGNALKQGLRALLVPPGKESDKPEFPPVPAAGEIFELEIDGDLDTTPAGWKALGPDFPKGKRVYRAKLLNLGAQPNLEAARKATKVKEPEFVMAPGAASEAFVAKFPRHNDRRVVMGGQEWQGPDRGRCVACVYDSDDGLWGRGLSLSGGGFHIGWLWLVVKPV